MKLLADENIPRIFVDTLIADGHDVLWAWLTHRGASDDQLGTIAEAEGRIMMSFDKDFGELVFRQGRRFGVILLRLRQGSPAQQAAVVAAALRTRDDWDRSFAVIEDQHVRSAPLPYSIR